MRLQATAALAVSLVLWWWFGGVRPAVFAGLLAALSLVAWVLPERYAPVQRGLDVFSRWIAVGFSWFVLGLIYFGLFTPLRWFGSLLGRDPLCLKTRDDATSYLQPLPPAATERFKREY
jgi:hypothetical protein